MARAMPDRDFTAMCSSDIEAADTSDWIAVLPLGATEQHGPHLPPETDTLIAEGVVTRLKQMLPNSLKVTFLAVEPVGYSPEHLDYAGSKSLAYDEAIERWVGIGQALHASGIRKLLLLNAHGGNSPLMTIVATELRCRYAMLCVATSWTRFGRPPGLMRDADAALDIHGGEIETSVMLALHPDRVDMTRARNFPSSQRKWLEENRFLHAYGRHSFGWKMQDLNADGVVGDAAAATAEKGEALLDHVCNGLMVLFEEVNRFELGQLKSSPPDAIG